MLTSAALFARGIVAVFVCFYFIYFPSFFFFPSAGGSVPRFPPLPAIPSSCTAEDAPAPTKFPPKPLFPISESNGLRRIILALVVLGAGVSPVPTWDFWDGLDGTEQRQRVGLRGR